MVVYLLGILVTAGIGLILNNLTNYILSTLLLPISLVLGLGIYWFLESENFLGRESWVNSVSYGLISGLTSFVFYHVFKVLVGPISLLFTLSVIVLGLLFIFRPALLGDFVGVVSNIVGGD